MTEWFQEWRTYRVAYGVQKKWNNPTRLQWAEQITLDYDPTIEELFRDITLEEGECYFLLISKLDVNNRNIEACKKDVDRAIKRFPELYSATAAADGTPPRVENDAIRPTGPKARDNPREPAPSGGGSPQKRHRSGKQRARISDLLNALSNFR